MDSAGGGSRPLRRSPPPPAYLKTGSAAGAVRCIIKKRSAPERWSSTRECQGRMRGESPARPRTNPARRTHTAAGSVLVRKKLSRWSEWSEWSKWSEWSEWSEWGECGVWSEWSVWSELYEQLSNL